MPDRRSRNRLIRRLLVFGPAIIVVLTGLGSFAALRRSVTTRESVAHTRDVLDASSALFALLLDAESSERGYLLTSDSAYLGPARSNGPLISRTLARLRMLTADNPAQQRRLDTLDARVGARLAVIDSVMARAAVGRSAEAIAIVAHAPGRLLMAEVRRLIGGIDAEESRLLRIRVASEQGATTLTSILLVAGTLIAALLGFVANRSMDRALADRRRALDAERAANSQLQAQAAELERQAETSQSAALESELATERAREAMYTAELSERRTERLQQATEAFGGALTLDAVATHIVDQAIAALHADSGLLAILEPSRDELRFIATRNISAVKVGDTIAVKQERPLCNAVRTGQPIVLSEPARPDGPFGAVAAVHAREGVQSIAAFPMEFEGRVLGGLLVRFNRPQELRPADIGLLGALTRIAAESVERARLFEAEREARAAAETANRAKAAFLASMSHELRTPLQAALGFAQLVRSGVYGEVNPQQAEVLGRVERSQTHLARLIDDILDFARLEAGRVRITAEPVAVADVFAEVAPLVEPQAAARQVALTMLPAPQDAVACADRHRLRQILVNLVGNAIKFTPQHGRVDVSATRDDGTVVISVADTGAGIPADRLEAVFQPFVQVDDTLTRVHEGAGLGLAISRDLARAMGGDVTVESVLDRGSIFHLTLPADE